MSLPSALAAELRPLVLLLSSDRAGEVAVAAGMIGRKLGRAGLDWHALADAVERGARDVDPDRPRFAEEWTQVVDHILEQAAALDVREEKFVRSMRQIVARGWEPTQKQAAWLRALFARTGGVWTDAAA